MPELQTHRNEDDSEEDQDLFHDKLIKKHVDQLMEHFSSVRILTTRYKPDSENTAFISQGGGDFAAQYGVCKDWVEIQEERMRISIRQQME